MLGRRNAHDPLARCLAPLAGATLAALAPAQTTWTVDDNPGADFVHVQDAVDVAQPGDVIEIATGAYASFAIDGKGLVVHASGPDVDVAGPIVVRNVPADEQVELDGLTVAATYAVQGEPALRVHDNAGTVRVVDCTLFGADSGCEYCGYGSYPDCGPFTQRALRVDATFETVLLRCTLVGGRAASEYYLCGSYWDGSDAVTVVDSGLTVLECDATGGHGGDSPYTFDACYNGGRGGNGVHVQGSSTFFANLSSFQGGAGGFYSCDNDLFPCCGSGGIPGLGVRLALTATGTFRESTFVDAGAQTNAPAEVLASPYCIGTFEECPCGNAGRGVAGCENSAGTGGALLEAVGWPSVSSDTLTLRVTGLNPNASPTGLFFQGTTRPFGGMGTVLNDGLLCTGGEIIRLKGKTGQNGAVIYGHNDPSDPAVSVGGEVPVGGGTRYYQFWYRNQPAMFCPPAQFNMSNGLEVTWVP